MQILAEGRSRLGKVVASWAQDSRGAVAVLFGLALIPLTFMVGAALDYSGAANLRTHLQKATDGTNLSLCQMPLNSTNAALTDQANRMMSGYLGSTGYTIEALTTTTNPWTVAMTTRSVFQTAIVKGLSSSFATIPVTATAKCFGQPQTFEIALVLDNTGSMNNSGGGTTKIAALRQAATDFVNFVFTTPKMAAGSRVSLVPFAAAVAVDPSSYRNASWIDQAGLSPNHWSILQGGKIAATAAGWTNRFDLFSRLRSAQSSWDWAGCFESLPYPLNTQDVAPSALTPGSYYVPMLSPDESGSGGENPNSGHADTPANPNPPGRSTNDPYNLVISINSYLDDYDGSLLCPNTTNEDARVGRACKYSNPRNARTNNGLVGTGPNVYCTTRPLTRLSRSQSTLVNEISQLQADGSTNIHEGLMWGWRTLSPTSIFRSGTTDQTPTAYGTPYNNKVIVLMTDGANTWNVSPFGDSYNWNILKSYHSAYGYLRNPDGTTTTNRFPSSYNTPANATQTRASIDQLTREGCTAAKTAGVKIYTVGFSVSGDQIDAQGLSLLSGCASDPSYFYVANDSSSLQSVFQQIAQSIGDLRLTN